MEAKKNLPVTSFMQDTSEQGKARLNISFIEHVAAPLWKTLAEVFPPIAENIQVIIVY